MKRIFILAVCMICINNAAHSQQLNFNDKIFNGRLTEITPPDVDRMPKVFDETIRFSGDKVFSHFLKNFSVDECPYYMEVDGRRAVAVDVWIMKFSAEGMKDGKKVSIEFSGDVMAHDTFSGELTIKYPDNSEEKYLLEAKAV